MSNCNGNCNGRGVGFAPYLFTDDAASEVQFDGLRPVYAVLPEVETASGNKTADLVAASLGAQSLTGSNNLKPAGIVDDSIRVTVGAALTGKSGQVLYFSDDEQPYKPAAAAVDAPAEVPEPTNKVVKYGAIGLGAYLAWRLLGG